MLSQSTQKKFRRLFPRIFPEAISFESKSSTRKRRDPKMRRRATGAPVWGKRPSGPSLLESSSTIGETGATFVGSSDGSGPGPLGGGKESAPAVEYGMREKIIVQDLPGASVDGIVAGAAVGIGKNGGKDIDSDIDMDNDTEKLAS